MRATRISVSSSQAYVAVAIPVKNEAERIGDCLRALALQRGAPPIEVVLLLNGCTDDSAARVRALTPTLPMRVHAVERHLPAGRAGAGHARRLAMAHAARLAPEGVLLTTDADGRVPPDWVALKLAALAQGADAIAGQAIIDPVEALLIPAALHEDDARECEYAALLDRIAALVDPDPADPWPRHSEHSGASIAVTTRAYRAAGGIAALPLGEDRAFFEALRRIDARIRHAPEIRVTVSGRIEGRAEGGMADTMRRRMVAPDEMLDEQLEPPRAAARRAIWRAGLRAAWRLRDTDHPILPRLAARLALPRELLRQAVKRRFFGATWAEIEAASPTLRRVRVPAPEVLAVTAEARHILGLLRARQIAPRTPPLIRPACETREDNSASSRSDRPPSCVPS